MVKFCKSCNQEKPIAEYYLKKGTRDGLYYKCKSCISTHWAEYRKRNPHVVKNANKNAYQKKREERIEYARIWAENNPEKRKAARLRHKERNPEYSRESILKRHGLTIEQFKKSLVEQNNSCWICGDGFKSPQDAKMDHCHSSGRVRGILCSHCNTAIGLAKEDVVVLKKMIEYLEKFKQ